MAGPMLLGFILGPMMEEYLRRAMLLSRGDPLVLFQRPISAAIRHRRAPAASPRREALIDG